MKLMVICGIAVLLSGFPVYGAPTRTGPGHDTRPWVQYGLASWYGDREQGRLMACGERFDAYAMVAAHPTLPLGSTVQVTNAQNGRSVVVRIMDRGPHVAGRVIDLSKAAAEQLRFIHQGLAPVRIRVLCTPAEQTRKAGFTRTPERQHRDTAQMGKPLTSAGIPQPPALTRQ